MDAVIAYVNPMDEYWRVQYDLVVGGILSEDRYTDYGILKYALRGISEHMPYIENVFLIVSSESQIPDYVNTEKVKIVLHKDFIPQEFLPTFSPSAIECFLWNIPGLSEQFIYFNDDMVPISEIHEEEFFNGNTPCMVFTDENIKDGQYKTYIEMTNKRISRIAGIETTELLRPIHTAIPYLKSVYRGIYDVAERTIVPSIKKIRTANCTMQYFFTNYGYYFGVYDKLTPKLLYLKTCDVDKIDSNFANCQILCINDTTKSTMSTFSERKEKITSILDSILPNKSKYEL